MGLNLMKDAWIPVRIGTQTRHVRPWEIVDPAIEWVDWERGDLNLACLELLIGLVLIADPPVDERDLVERYYRPEPHRLRDRMESLAEYFEVAGAGPRFMQDLEAFEEDEKSEPRAVELIFLDAGGMRTRVKNADIAVYRGRYDSLSLGVGAMALYTLQSWAPAGGPGQFTSLRGGGPLVTLAQPEDLDSHGLWRTVSIRAAAHARANLNNILAEAGAVAMLKLAGAVREANALLSAGSGTAQRPKGVEVRGMSEAREEILSATEEAFTRSVEAVANGEDADVEATWNATLRRVALRVFDRHLLSDLSARGPQRIEKVTRARRFLRAAFDPKGAVGKLPIPVAPGNQEST